MNLNVLLPILMILGLICGCSAPKPKAGALIKTWSESVANLGFRAVYPLQENLYPGAILLVPAYPGKDRSDEKPSEFYTKYALPVGTLDQCSLFLTLRHTPEMPQVVNYVSQGISPQENPISPWQPTEIKYSQFKCDSYREADFKLNRAVAFPGFRFGSAVSSALGGNLAVGTVGVKGGAASNDEYFMTVSVPSATVIRIDAADIFTALIQKTYDSPHNALKLSTVVNFVHKLLQVPDEKGTTTLPELLVVSEVYYANAIDISISNSAGYSAQAAASTEALIERYNKLTALRDQLKSISVSDTVGSTANSTLEKADAQQPAMKELVRQVAEEQAEVDKLAKTLIPDAPGVTGAVKYASGTGVTLTQVFPRPMAIGYRAFGLRTESYLSPTKLSGEP